jgi:hypothetical protein
MQALEQAFRLGDMSVPAVAEKTLLKQQLGQLRAQQGADRAAALKLLAWGSRSGTSRSILSACGMDEPVPDAAEPGRDGDEGVSDSEADVGSRAPRESGLSLKSRSTMQGTSIEGDDLLGELGIGVRTGLHKQHVASTVAE